jgi:hypothetical protein
VSLEMSHVTCEMSQVPAIAMPNLCHSYAITMLVLKPAGLKPQTLNVTSANKGALRTNFGAKIFTGQTTDLKESLCTYWLKLKTPIHIPMKMCKYATQKKQRLCDVWVCE